MVLVGIGEGNTEPARKTAFLEIAQQQARTRLTPHASRVRLTARLSLEVEVRVREPERGSLASGL